MVEIISKVESSEFSSFWYDVVQSDHFWMRKRFDFLLESFKKSHLPINKALKVLDIGSGNGVPRKQIEAETAWTVDCCDLDGSALEMLSGGRGRNLLYDFTHKDPRFIGKYDVVLLLDVLEHIPEPHEFLQSAIAHLKPGGHLVINVPALKLLMSRYDEVVGHLRRYTISNLEGELAGLSLQTKNTNYWGFFFIPILLLRKWMVSRIENNDEVIKTGMKPISPLVNRLLGSIMTLEQKILPWRPAGTSLIYIGELKS